MNPREKKMAIIIGTVIGLGVLYKGVDFLIVGPVTSAKKEQADLVNARNALTKLVKSEKKLAETWRGLTGRTFSYEAAEAQDLFGQELKNIAKQHGFDAASFTPRGGSRIGLKNEIGTVAYRITDTGSYTKVMEFLRDIYHAPFLCQITSLTLTPLGPKAGRDMVKVEFTVESPVLPRIDERDSRVASTATTMPAGPDTPKEPFRKDLLSDTTYLVLEDRNIFRSYLPAPDNLVMVDNQDTKTVGLIVKFFWDNKEQEQLVETVAGKTQKPVSGKGGIVEITGSYADGKTFGPQRFDFSQKKDWTFRVDPHTPPETVILAVTNEDEKDIHIDLVISGKENKRITPPTMIIKGKSTIDVGEFEASQVQVTAQYVSGKPAANKAFAAKVEKQTLVIGKEPLEIVREPTHEVSDVPDAAPDARFTVTGLWMYRDVQEMIVSAGPERKVIVSGEAATVDGGTLLAVHPHGGVVWMPLTGHYYLYPLGKSFTERVLLNARSTTELASAIDEWTEQGH